MFLNYNRKLTLLDCTLRDGGYYNNWNFTPNEIRRYISSISKSNINVIEVGFHFLQKNSEYGKCAYIDNEFIKNLKIKKNIKVAVMFNANDFLNDKFTFKRINKIFKKKKNLIDIVRIAAHSKDIKKIKPYLDYFKKKKILVCLNLMQINTLNKLELTNHLRVINKWNNVDIFYFADSFGSLRPKDVKKICINIKKIWKKEFGIHSHDNCNLALQNSIAAFKNGATWIDGTILGMGRGAGNVKTELLLKHFKNFKYKAKAVKDLCSKEFLKLKKRYNWGPSLYYKQAAKFNIHPSYIQYLLSDKNRYSKDEIKKSINNLAKINSRGYDPLILENSVASDENFEGKWNAKGWCRNRNILILGQGTSLSVKENLIKVSKLLIEKKPIVLSLNINKAIPENYIDYYVSSNEARILVDNKFYLKFKKNFIVPRRVLKSFTKSDKQKSILDYGVKIKKNSFTVFNNYAVLPINLSFAYSIALCLIGGARNISLAGFDGYGKNHKYQIQMNDTIKLIQSKYKDLKLYSLTKTQYHFKKN